jgi:hypothetical protein
LYIWTNELTQLVLRALQLAALLLALHELLALQQVLALHELLVLQQVFQLVDNPL